MLFPRLLTGRLATLLCGAVIAALLNCVVLERPQDYTGGAQELIDSIVDSLMNCPEKRNPEPVGNFYFEFEAPSLSGPTNLFRITSVDFTGVPAYSIGRVGPASLDRDNEGLILSFYYRIDEPKQINYNYNITSDLYDSETYYTGKVSTEFGESSAFYQIRIYKEGGHCRLEVEKDVLERIGECTTTVTDVPVFKTHTTLKDQITYWAGSNGARTLLRRLYQRRVSPNLNDCIEHDAEHHEKLCKLLSTVPIIPKKYKTYHNL